MIDSRFSFRIGSIIDWAMLAKCSHAHDRTQKTRFRDTHRIPNANIEHQSQYFVFYSKKTSNWISFLSSFAFPLRLSLLCMMFKKMRCTLRMCFGKMFAAFLELKTEKIFCVWTSNYVNIWIYLLCLFTHLHVCVRVEQASFFLHLRVLKNQKLEKPHHKHTFLNVKVKQ